MTQTTVDTIDTIRENATSIAEREADALQRTTNAADLILAASFNEAALPDGFELTYARALIAADRRGEWSFTNGGGPVIEVNGKIYIDGHVVDEDDTGVEAFQAMVDEMDRRREREEWANNQHEYFGAKLTGKEWGQLSDAVGDGGALHQRLIDKLMKDGKSREQAEEQAAYMARVYRILSKPESQWTAEEKEKVEAAKKDPNFTRNTQWLADFKQGKNLGIVNEAELRSTQGGQIASVKAGAALLDAPFPTAPSATEDFQAALIATEPLDAPKVPVQVAALTPQPIPAASPGGGFDS